MAEESAKGSSRAPSTSGRTSSMSRWRIRNSWCSVPYMAATRRARPVSSYSLSSANPTVKVLTGREEARAIRATTMPESIPPLKKAPTGTSASMHPDTASDKVSTRRRCSRPTSTGIRAFRGSRQAPVARDGKFAVFKHERAARLQLADPPEHRQRCRHIINAR